MREVCKKYAANFLPRQKSAANSCQEDEWFRAGVFALSFVLTTYVLLFVLTCLGV
jgi:hypothetical protein